MQQETEIIEEPQYLTSLNPEQLEAVKHIDGALLVLSGAGTGKTKVLTTRICHILASKRAFPSQILAVTFTNKAAKEMSERINSMIGSMASGLWIGTFHSIAARILRRHAKVVGLEDNFTILDDDDQLRLIKQLMQENNIDDKRWSPRMMLSYIHSMKDKGLTPDKVKNSEHASFASGKGIVLYTAYQKRLLTINAVDFGDLLLHNLSIFSNYPEILEEYSKRFRYILVDEYQDTNVAQYLWLRLLSLVNKNICCVGDDDQAIYGWRGAEVDNILRFEKDYPNAKVVKLEQNYRSTSAILAAASGLIKKNAGRLGKTLWTEGDKGDLIKIINVYDDRDEAKFIAEEIEAIAKDYGGYGECAVLVRAGFQTRSFEERFMMHGLPYKIIGGLRFYERQEIKDAIAYIRLLVQPNDDLAFERIINTPKRGVGASSLELIRKTAREHSISMFKSLIFLIENGGIKGKTAITLNKFLRDYERFNSLIGNMPHHDLVNLILDETGYRDIWKAEKTPDSQTRLDNLKELVAAISEFEDLQHFLEHVGLVSDTEQSDEGGKVNIMTLHASKGLEFNVVFLPGWEDGIFPSQRSMDEKGIDGLEEERRLAYVGMTRARKRLFILHANSRRVYNQIQNNIPSRFIAEIPENSLEFINHSGLGLMSSFMSSDLRSEINNLFKSTEQRNSPQSQSAPLSQSKYKVGARVIHDQFGYGRIMGINANRLDILFDDHGIKKIMEDFIREG